MQDEKAIFFCQQLMQFLSATPNAYRMLGYCDFDECYRAMNAFVDVFHRGLSKK